MANYQMIKLNENYSNTYDSVIVAPDGRCSLRNRINFPATVSITNPTMGYTELIHVTGQYAVSIGYLPLLRYDLLLIRCGKTSITGTPLIHSTNVPLSGTPNMDVIIRTYYDPDNITIVGLDVRGSFRGTTLTTIFELGNTNGSNFSIYQVAVNCIQYGQSNTPDTYTVPVAQITIMSTNGMVSSWYFGYTISTSGNSITLGVVEDTDHFRISSNFMQYADLGRTLYQSSAQLAKTIADGTYAQISKKFVSR